LLLSTALHDALPILPAALSSQNRSALAPYFAPDVLRARNISNGRPAASAVLALKNTAGAEGLRNPAFMNRVRRIELSQPSLGTEDRKSTRLNSCHEW